MKGPASVGGPDRRPLGEHNGSSGSVPPGEHGASARGGGGRLDPSFLFGKHVCVVIKTTLCVGTGRRLGWKREVGSELRNGLVHIPQNVMTRMTMVMMRDTNQVGTRSGTSKSEVLGLNELCRSKKEGDNLKSLKF